MITTIQAFDPQCKSRCGIICHLEDGKLIKVGMDPEHPNRTALCPKGIASPELVYHPERLKTPLKRTRAKTDPDPGWKQIGWEEAMDAVSRKLKHIRKKFGAEAVVFGKGASGGTPGNHYKPWISRLALAFGSPNGDLGTTHICNWHKDKGSVYTYGVGIPSPDFKHANCILLWGHNPAATWKKHLEEVNAARKRGARVIIIDPRRNETWREGDLWLPVRPGTDLALALSMLNVMIQERLHDEAFTRYWTNAPFLVRKDNGRLLRANDVDTSGSPGHYLVWDQKGNRLLGYDSTRRRYTGSGRPALKGNYVVESTAGKPLECSPAFQCLTSLVMKNSPEKAEEITWVEAEKIREAARLFAQNKPSCYYSYNGIEQHINAMQTNRAVCIFFALSGNFDRPGGNVIFPKIKTNKIDGKNEFQVDKLTLGKESRPLGPSNVQARDLYRAILEEKPYPVKALVAFGGNVLTANGDSKKGKEALEKLDFYVHADLFETPAAQKADILLPVVTAFETAFLKPSFEGMVETSSHVQLMPQIIPPLHEAKADSTIIFELAERLGLGDKFWDGDLEAAYNYQLAPSGISLEKLRETPMGISVSLPVIYEKYKEEDGNAGIKGFDTPSGRMEIYSETFLENAFDPLPEFKEPMTSPFSKPDLAGKYPFILTNAKLLAYCHGQHRGVPSLRKLAPYPYVEIHRNTANKLGIQEGAWVAMETPTGSIQLRAKLTEGIHPRVVCTQHGWWQGCKALDLPAYDPFSPKGANVNLLVPNELADPISGSVPHKSYMCNIKKL